MRDKRALCSIVLVLLFWAGAAQAGAAGLPERYSPAIDGQPVSVVRPGTGETYSVWSYRGRGEFDIAIASLDSAGIWSEPVFLGRDDRRDQVTPALVADAQGTLYLAFSVRETGEIQLSMLPARASAWTAPLALTRATERGFSPALSVVSDRLVVAWREFGGTVQIRDLPLVVPTTTHGINDGPDGIDPLGQSGGGSSSPPPGKMPGEGRGR